MKLKVEACLVEGKWVTNGQWLEVCNPVTDAVVGRVPAMGRVETQDAIDAAARAFPAWSVLPASQRAAHLSRLAMMMREAREDLANLLCSEQGKPLREARAEIDYAASFLDWFAEEARRTYGDVIPPHASDKRLFVIRQPIGVVAAITPWNFPAAMVTRKIAPALAAGCTVVLKPAEQTPFTALALGKLAQEAGIPAGVLNIVTGPPVEIGDALTASPVVRKLTFTGSSATGARLMAQCSPSIKKLSLELGGNAPFIVFPDADLESAVAGAIASKFRNAGQTCVCANRFFVHEDIYDAFLARFAEAVEALSVGDPLDETSDIGPLIDRRAILKVTEHIADAIAGGATVVAGGAPHDRGGNFFQPTVLGNVTMNMRAVQEEIFGPVAPIVKFSSESELVAWANDTPFGLAAYVFTRDISRAWRISEALEVGMVGLNTGLISTEVAPFGGVKASGLGREGGSQGIDDYMEQKFVCLGL